MRSSFEYTGVWWLPGSEEHVAGTISYDGKEFPRLKLVGLLHELADLNDPDLHYDLILGVANGKNITLAKAIQIGTQVTFPGIPTSEIAAPIVVIGAHIDHLENLRFRKLAVSYDHLIEWSGISSIARDTPADGRPSLTFRVESPNSPEFVISDARCKFAPSWGTTAETPYETAISQDLAIEVAPPQALTLDDYLSKYFYHIQNFLALGVGAPAGIRRVSGLLELEEDNRKRVDVIFKARSAEGKTIHQWDMLFRRADLGEEWHRALDRWIERAEVLRPVYDLFFSIVFGSNMYLQHEFLSLTQALESYHRRTVPGTYLPEDVFSDVRQELTAVITSDSRIPPEVKTALDGKLTYFNELSQRRRFKEILRGLGDLTSLLIQNVPDFVDLVVNTRNYLTHYDPASRDSSASTQEMWNLGEQLRFILELCFLKELGMSREMISTLIQRNQKYLRLRSALTRAAPSPS